MKLHRFVIADFSPAVSEFWIGKAGPIGTAVVRSEAVDGESGKRTRLLVRASTPLSSQPEKDSEGALIIPADDRIQCENAAEHYVNLISVLEGCSRSISSPLRCVGLEPMNDDECTYLSTSIGIRTINRSQSAASMRIQFSSEIAAGLADRMDGVALLSEALSSTGGAGEYRDFVRFLELAFALPFTGLSKKLSQFLRPAYRYTREEINDWVALRHPSMHADLKEASEVALTNDVRPFVFRMRQACFDVLFNKAEWRSRSSQRRELWRPDAITTSRSGDLIIRQGSQVDLNVQVFDEYGIYPLNLNASMNHAASDLYGEVASSPGHDSAP
jgi:hypothetical protein